MQTYDDNRILAEIEVCEDESQRTILILLLQTQRSLVENTEYTRELQVAIYKLETELKEPLEIYTRIKSSLIVFDRVITLFSRMFNFGLRSITALVLLLGSFVAAAHFLVGNSAPAKELTKLILSLLAGKAP